MKAQARFKDGVLLISSSRFTVWIITITGIILGITGIYTLFRSMATGHLFFSTGIILTATGLFSYLDSRYYKIYLNDEQGNINILESTFKRITSFAIPAQRYSMISVQTRLYCKGQKRIEKYYDVVLMNDFGSSLYLNGFKNRNDAIDFAHKLEECCDKEVHIDNAPKIKKVKLSDMEKLQLPEDLTVTKTISAKPHGKEQTLRWKNSFSYLHILYVTAIFYGLFHMHHFFISNRPLPEALNSHLYTIIILFYGLTLFFILVKNSITHVITITPAEISFYLQVLNKWIGFKEIKRDKPVLIKNSLNMYHDVIEVMGGETAEHLNRLQESLSEDTSQNDISLIKRLRYILSKTMRMNTQSLTIAEKFYIEDQLLNK